MSNVQSAQAAYSGARCSRFPSISANPPWPKFGRRSAVLPALYLAQAQQGYITANAIRHVAELLGMRPRDPRYATAAPELAGVTVFISATS